MKQLSVRERFFWIFIILLSLLLFHQSFAVFFSADDFYNMYLVKDGVGEVISSFLFIPRSDFLFYRPISTQLYFYLAKPLFGFYPLGYHIVSFAVFLGILFALYKLSEILFNKTTALFCVLFYMLSPSNLIRLAWIVQIQELLLGLFGFASLYFWTLFHKKNQRMYYWISLLFFVLSLMSKETSVVIPLLFILIDIFLLRKRIASVYKFYTIPFLVLVSYSYLRFFILGVSTGKDYFTDFSIKSILNTVGWYVLWIIGIPEYLSGINIFKGWGINSYLVNEIFNNYPLLGISFVLFLIILIYLSISFVRSNQFKVNVLKLIFCLGWFFITLFPLIFSPWHKFSYNLTLPLYGSSLFIALLVSSYYKQKNSTIGFIAAIVVLYMYVSTQTITAEKQTHWVFQRSSTANHVFLYLRSFYPYVPKGSSIIFMNERGENNPKYSISKELSTVLSQEKAIRLLYDDDSLPVRYLDIEYTKQDPTNKTIIIGGRSFFD